MTGDLLLLTTTYAEVSNDTLKQVAVYLLIGWVVLWAVSKAKKGGR